MTPACTRLQKRDPERNQHRYYLLSIQPNLFGTWSPIREWGRIGRPGWVKIDLCDSLEEAAHAFNGKLYQKQRRLCVTLTRNEHGCITAKEPAYASTGKSQTRA